MERLNCSLFKLAPFLAITLFTSVSLASTEHRVNHPVQHSSPSTAQFDISVGLSPYSGVVGLEYQIDHYAVGFGMLGSLNLKRYTNPNTHGSFIGVGVGRYKFNVDFLKGNDYYDEYTSAFMVFGGGYRWLWESGVNLEASLSVISANEKYHKGYYEGSNNVTLLYPGISLGYAF